MACLPAVAPPVGCGNDLRVSSTLTPAPAAAHSYSGKLGIPVADHQVVNASSLALCTSPVDGSLCMRQTGHLGRHFPFHYQDDRARTWLLVPDFDDAAPDRS